jgi:hypothetical protein
LAKVSTEIEIAAKTRHGLLYYRHVFIRLCSCALGTV